MIRSLIYLTLAPEDHAVSHISPISHLSNQAAALQKCTETDTLCKEQMSGNSFLTLWILESFPRCSNITRVSEERNTWLERVSDICTYF